MKPAETEVWEPVPQSVTTGKTTSEPPSDAVILFDGTNLNQWVSSKDTASPAGWVVSKGVVTVKKGTGDIQTKQSFLDYQLHIEWKIPEKITGSGQARGNSGIFLSSASGGYELQVIDTYKNKTYVNGEAGALYKQYPPLVNASRPPGVWQIYDVIWTAPRFNDDGSIKTPARATVLFNGVLVQNNAELKGPTANAGRPAYRKHGAAPIKLQDHGDPSEPISYRNIWVRPL
jgi:hypothetical protein